MCKGSATVKLGRHKRRVESGTIRENFLSDYDLVCVLHMAQLYGSGRSTLEHIRCLKKHFRSVAVFVPEHGPLVRHIEWLGVPCYVVPFEHRNLRQRDFWKVRWRDVRDVVSSRLDFIRQLTRFLLQRKSLVHVQSSVCIYGILAARLAQCPVVVHVRETRRPGIVRWGREQCAAWMADRVIAVSQGILRGYGRRLRSKARVIYNFVEIPAFERELKHLVRPVVGFIGSLHFEKGIREFLQMCEVLAHSGCVFEARMYGKPLTQEIESWCQEFVRQHQLTEKVRFMGECESIEEMYRQVDILVHPSYYDALPRAVMEAMAYGIAVVATRVGGIPEMIGNEFDILVEPCDVHGLVRVTMKLLQDEVQRQLIGNALQARARRLFGRDRYESEMIAIYRDLIQTGRQR